MNKGFLLLSGLSLLLTACNFSQKGEHTNQSIVNSSQDHQSSSESFSKHLEKLQTPVAEYNENTHVISWSNIANAEGYSLQINSRTYEIHDLAYLVKFEFDQFFTFRIKALGDQKNYEDSDFSDTKDGHFVIQNSSSSSIEEEENDYISANSIDVMEKKNIVNRNERYKESTNYTSFYDDNYYYYVFDMGTLSNVPLTDTFEYKYYSGKGVIEEKYTTITTTTSSIKSCATTSSIKAVETLNTNEIKVNGTSNTKFNIGVVKESLTISAGWTGQRGDVSTDTNSWDNSFEECQSFSSTTEKTRIIKFDSSCPKGYYSYRYIGVLNVYVSVVVDRASLESDETIAYIDTYSSMKAYGYAFDYDESSEVFDKNYDDSKFSFDATVLNNIPAPTFYIGDEEEKTVENIVEYNGHLTYKPLSKTLEFDLSSFEEAGIFTQEDFAYPDYDGSTIVIYPDFRGNPVEKVKIIGNYGNRNEKGVEIKTPFSDLCIVFDSSWYRDVEVTIVDFAAFSTNQFGCLDFSRVPADYTVSLTVEGSNYFRTLNPADVIRGNSLNIQGSTKKESALYLIGCNGDAGQADSNGVHGGSGIVAEKITLNNLYINAKAGNGGTGGTGSNGHGNDYGKTGGTGGNGGHGIYCKTLDIKDSELVLCGGDGGIGGRSGESKLGGWKIGEIGVKGGTGGTGGNGIYVLLRASQIGSTLDLTAGKGGSGGEGGGWGGEWAAGCSDGPIGDSGRNGDTINFQI